MPLFKKKKDLPEGKQQFVKLNTEFNSVQDASPNAASYGLSDSSRPLSNAPGSPFSDGREKLDDHFWNAQVDPSLSRKESGLDGSSQYQVKHPEDVLESAPTPQPNSEFRILERPVTENAVHNDNEIESHAPEIPTDGFTQRVSAYSPKHQTNGTATNDENMNDSTKPTSGEIPHMDNTSTLTRDSVKPVSPPDSSFYKNTASEYVIQDTFSNHDNSVDNGEGKSDTLKSGRRSIRRKDTSIPEEPMMEGSPNTHNLESGLKNETDLAPNFEQTTLKRTLKKPAMKNRTIKKNEAVLPKEEESIIPVYSSEESEKKDISDGFGNHDTNLVTSAGEIKEEKPLSAIKKTVPRKRLPSQKAKTLSPSSADPKENFPMEAENAADTKPISPSDAEDKIDANTETTIGFDHSPAQDVPSDSAVQEESPSQLKTKAPTKPKPTSLINKASMKSKSGPENLSKTKNATSNPSKQIPKSKVTHASAASNNKPQDVKRASEKTLADGKKSSDQEQTKMSKKGNISYEIPLVETSVVHDIKQATVEKPSSSINRDKNRNAEQHLFSPHENLDFPDLNQATGSPLIFDSRDRHTDSPKQMHNSSLSGGIQEGGLDLMDSVFGQTVGIADNDTAFIMDKARRALEEAFLTFEKAIVQKDLKHIKFVEKLRHQTEMIESRAKMLKKEEEDTLRQMYGPNSDIQAVFYDRKLGVFFYPRSGNSLEALEAANLYAENPKNGDFMLNGKVVHSASKSYSNYLREKYSEIDEKHVSDRRPWSQQSELRQASNAHTNASFLPKKISSTPKTSRSTEQVSKSTLTKTLKAPSKDITKKTRTVNNSKLQSKPPQASVKYHDNMYSSQQDISALNNEQSPSWMWHEMAETQHSLYPQQNFSEAPLQGYDGYYDNFYSSYPTSSPWYEGYPGHEDYYNYDQPALPKAMPTGKQPNNALKRLPKKNK